MRWLCVLHIRKCCSLATTDVPKTSLSGVSRCFAGEMRYTGATRGLGMSLACRGALRQLLTPPQGGVPCPGERRAGVSGRLGTFGSCTCALDYSVDARALAVGRNGG